MRKCCKQIMIAFFVDVFNPHCSHNGDKIYYQCKKCGKIKAELKNIQAN